MQRSRKSKKQATQKAEKQRSRKAEKQKSREVDKQRSSKSKIRKSRKAEKQRSRKAERQNSREAGKHRTRNPKKSKTCHGKNKYIHPKQFNEFHGVRKADPVNQKGKVGGQKNKVGQKNKAGGQKNKGAPLIYLYPLALAFCVPGAALGLSLKQLAACCCLRALAEAALICIGTSRISARLFCCYLCASFCHKKFEWHGPHVRQTRSC